MSFTLHGIGVSGGIAIGHAHLVSHTQLEVPHIEITAKSVVREQERFDRQGQTNRCVRRCKRTAKACLKKKI